MVTEVNSGNERQQPLTENMTSDGRQVAGEGVNAPADRSTRGQIGKIAKKSKHSERFSEIQKSMPEPVPKLSQGVDRQGVQLSLDKFSEMLSSRDSKPTEVLRDMRNRFSKLCVNNKYSMLGEFGSVPGIEVGDCFSWRAELSLVGLHRPTQAGIDWKDVTFTRTDGNCESLAISLVISGRYEDNLDQGDTLFYTGEGGKEKGAKQHTKDQKPDGGNMALMNSKFRQLPVRVIRGRPDKNRAGKRVFSYDGLYKVKDYVSEEGMSGFKIYKFRLVRETGQAPLVWSPIQFPMIGETSRKRAPRNLSKETREQGGSGKRTRLNVTTNEQEYASDESEEDFNPWGDEEVDSGSEEEDDMVNQDDKGEESFDDEATNPGEYEVKCILEKKIWSRKGKMFTKYLVWWKGYPQEEATWEPSTNLTNCEKVLEEFQKIPSS